MGGLARRMEELERREQERAVEDVRRFWDSLSVEECALVCAFVTAEERGFEPPQEALAFVERHSEEGNAVLYRAIGWHERMPEAEVIARADRLMDEIGLFEGREQAVRRRYEELLEAWS
jgi:hypothetical protein